MDLDKDKENRVIKAFIKARADDEYTDEDLKKIVEWARDAVIQYNLLDLVLRDLALPNIENGEVCFTLNPNPDISIINGTQS